MATSLVSTGVRFPDDTIRTSAREIIQVIGTNTTAVAFRTYVSPHIPTVPTEQQ